MFSRYEFCPRYMFDTTCARFTRKIDKIDRYWLTNLRNGLQQLWTKWPSKLRFATASNQETGLSEAASDHLSLVQVCTFSRFFFQKEKRKTRRQKMNNHLWLMLTDVISENRWTICFWIPIFDTIGKEIENKNPQKQSCINLVLWTFGWQAGGTCSRVIRMNNALLGFSRFPEETERFTRFSAFWLKIFGIRVL